MLGVIPFLYQKCSIVGGAIYRALFPGHNIDQGAINLAPTGLCAFEMEME